MTMDRGMPDNATQTEKSAYNEGFDQGYCDRLLGHPYKVSTLACPEFITGYGDGYYSDEHTK